MSRSIFPMEQPVEVARKVVTMREVGNELGALFVAEFRKGVEDERDEAGVKTAFNVLSHVVHGDTLAERKGKVKEYFFVDRGEEQAYSQSMPIVEMKHCEILANGFSQQRKQKFLQLFAAHHCDLGKVCDLVGIHAQTYYNHLDSDPTFAMEIRILKRRLAWALVPRQVERALANSPTDAIWLQKNLNQLEFNADRPSGIGGDRIVILQVNGAGLRDASTTHDGPMVDKIRQPRALSSAQARRMQTHQSASRRTKTLRARRQVGYQQTWRATHPTYQQEWRARRKQQRLDHSTLSDTRHHGTLPESPNARQDQDGAHHTES